MTETNYSQYQMPTGSGDWNTPYNNHLAAHNTTETTLQQTTQTANDTALTVAYQGNLITDLTNTVGTHSGRLNGHDDELAAHDERLDILEGGDAGTLAQAVADLQDSQATQDQQILALQGGGVAGLITTGSTANRPDSESPSIYVDTDVDAAQLVKNGGVLWDSRGLGAGSNAIINGNMGVWTAGTSFNVGANTFTATQWVVNAGSMGGVNGSLTVSRVPYTDYPNSEGMNPRARYFMRIYGAPFPGAQVGQGMPGVQRFAGELATFSINIKPAATEPESVVAITPKWEQNFGTGGTPSTNVTGQGDTVMIPSGQWTRVSATFELPSVYGKILGTNGDDTLRMMIGLSDVSIVDISLCGATLHHGPIDLGDWDAVPPGLTEILCQRFYQKTLGAGDRLFFNGDVTTGQTYFSKIIFPVPMRISPTVTLTNVSNNGFGATPGTPAVTAQGFNAGRAATATQARAYYYSDWAADAQIY